MNPLGAIQGSDALQQVFRDQAEASLRKSANGNLNLTELRCSHYLPQTFTTHRFTYGTLCSEEKPSNPETVIQTLHILLSASTHLQPRRPLWGS